VPFAVDAHADTAQRIVDLDEPLGAPSSQGEVSLARARAGGLGAQIFSIWVDPIAFPGEAAWPRTLRLIRGVCDQAGDRVGLARTGAEIRELRSYGKFAALMGVEGCHALGADGTPGAQRIDRLRQLGAMGVRYAAPTWTNSNDFAGSSGDAGRTRGLSDLGYELVAACAKVGILVDVSHVSDPTFDDLAAWARSTGRPLVASHSSARALATSPRNLTDEQLHVIADTGGVASVNFCPSFLDDGFRARCNAALKAPDAMAAHDQAHRDHADPGVASLMAYLARARFARALPDVPSVGRVADHVIHMISVAGEEHVGLGSDFDGIASVPAGLEDCSRLPALAEALGDRGLPPRVIEQVFAGNWLRVLDS
jgi:membrane dipeptidase